MAIRSVLGVVLVVVAGCGQAATLDDARIEASIGERLEQAYTVPVQDVSCPDGVEAEAGATFRCQVATAGGRVEVVARQTDGDGRLALDPAQAVLVAAEVAADIEVTLADRFDRDGVTVACPGPEIRVEEVGATFTCEATDGDEARTVEVRVRDGWGAVAYRVR